MLGIRAGVPSRRRRFFVPTDLDGLILGLRADLGITLNGSDVSAWADFSGQGNDAAQATAARQPTYMPTGGPGGRPGVRFTRADANWMDLGSMTDPSNSYTLFVAVDLLDKSQPHQDVLTSSTTGFTLNLGFTAETVATYDGAWINIAASQDGAQVVTLELDEASGGSSEAWRDGISIGTGSYDGTVNWAGPKIGSWASATHYLDATVSEILLYNRVLPAAELTRVHGYLVARHGL
jgi:hypothetical protein